MFKKMFATITLPAVLAFALSACEIPEDPVAQSTPQETKTGKKRSNVFSAGTYEVPKELKPGKYKTSGPDKDSWSGSCYWARLSNLNGEFDGIEANGNTEGPATITVKKTDKGVEFSGSCEWKRSK